MKLVKNILRYLLIGFYLFMGTMHLVQPQQYLAMMPTWLPSHLLLIYISGVIEILLALLLIPITTRTIAAKTIIAMLLIFFIVIHVPQSIDYYQTGNKNFIASIVRLPIQFLFIYWAWIFTKKN